MFSIYLIFLKKFFNFKFYGSIFCLFGEMFMRIRKFWGIRKERDLLDFKMCCKVIVIEVV